jgi:hypothetical protein
MMTVCPRCGQRDCPAARDWNASCQKDDPAIPDDDDLFDVENNLPTAEPTDRSQAALIMSVCEKLKIKTNFSIKPRQGYDGKFTREYIQTKQVPFWVFVIAHGGRGTMIRALKQAHENKDWRDAAMAVWRLGGMKHLTRWIRENT